MGGQNAESAAEKFSQNIGQAMTNVGQNTENAADKFSRNLKEGLEAVSEKVDHAADNIGLRTEIAATNVGKSFQNGVTGFGGFMFMAVLALVLGWIIHGAFAHGQQYALV